jgi:hypothetical protein
MKRYLFLMPVILATTAAIADTQATASSSRADAQAQAAALLSRPQTSAGVKADEMRASSSSPVSTSADGQAQAVALLSGLRPATQVRSFPRIAEPSNNQPSADAQAQAGALLSGSRAATHSQGQAQRRQDGAGTTGEGSVAARSKRPT